MTGIHLAGIDLAWHGKRPSGFAIGSLSDNTLHVHHLISEVLTNDELVNKLNSNDVTGIAIDAPLIIKNQSSMRDCERKIGQLYGAKGASCHTANLTLFPNATSVMLSKQLQQQHYQHIIGPRWQIECYPHPAIIELFNLEYRLAYKKGLVAARKAGQKALANHLSLLSNKLPFNLHFSDGLEQSLSEGAIDQLKGKQLKNNEDKLDALVCLVIAAMHHLNSTHVVGSEEDGYIVLPNTSVR